MSLLSQGGLIGGSEHFLLLWNATREHCFQAAPSFARSVRSLQSFVL